MKINDVLKEFTDTQGQYNTSTAPADPAPNQGFAVRLTAIPRVANGARLTWAALMSVLPKEFPLGDEYNPGPAQVLVGKLATSGQPQVIKSGLSRDMAETIADKITNWPSTVKIPTDVVEQ